MLVQQYYDGLGHMGVNWTYDVIWNIACQTNKIIFLCRRMRKVYDISSKDKALFSILSYVQQKCRVASWYLNEISKVLTTLWNTRYPFKNINAFKIVHHKWRKPSRNRNPKPIRRAKTKNKVGDPVFLKNNKETK